MIDSNVGKISPVVVTCQGLFLFLFFLVLLLERFGLGFFEIFPRARDRRARDYESRRPRDG